MFSTSNESTVKYESTETALGKYMELIGSKTSEPEEISVENALARILYDDITALHNLPAFNKSLVDGYAVNSGDISTADEEKPVTLIVIGEAHADDNKQLTIARGETVKISTGAMLPVNADAVVYTEDTCAEDKSVKIFKSVIMGENIARQGEDIPVNEVFIRKKRKIRPQDIGGIIGLGYKTVKVYKKPVVSIIPTGSELVSIDSEPLPGQIIASNSYVLKAAVEQLGGIGKICPIVKDNLDMVKESIINTLKDSDIILVSGGSSFGSKDYTLKAIEAVKNSKIVVHGIAVRPGRHTLLSLIDNKPVVGLPGHPVSSYMSFLTFVKPILVQFSGNPRSFWQERKDNVKIDAILARDVISPEGLEDHVRVRLKLLDNGKITAYPYAGRSSFLSTLVKAHGTIKLARDCSKLYEGDRVQVSLF